MHQTKYPIRSSQPYSFLQLEPHQIPISFCHTNSSNYSHPSPVLKYHRIFYCFSFFYSFVPHLQSFSYYTPLISLSRSFNFLPYCCFRASISPPNSQSLCSSKSIQHSKLVDIPIASIDKTLFLFSIII